MTAPAAVNERLARLTEAGTSIRLDQLRRSAMASGELQRLVDGDSLPRLLHSTGQHHKGGPPAGRFLRLAHDAPQAVDVSGEPYGQRRLIDAQADCGLQTLRARGLPAARVRLPADGLAAAIDRITARI